MNSGSHKIRRMIFSLYFCPKKNMFEREQCIFPLSLWQACRIPSIPSAAAAAAEEEIFLAVAREYVVVTNPLQSCFTKFMVS